MTDARYNHQDSGQGFYAQVFLDSRVSPSERSFVTDACSWKMIMQDNPGYVILPGYHAWKDAVIQGIAFGLSRIETTYPYEVLLLDLNGHMAHSNLHAMFGAGMLAVFKELDITLSQADLKSLYAFMGSSAGTDNIWKRPDETSLTISAYSV